jgi:Sulfotransferase domain
MFERFRAGTKVLFRLHCPGRTLQIFPDDVFLVSFPKSGNTWTRFLIANLAHPETPATFGNIHELVPDPEGTAKRLFDRIPRPRIIKSHECFDPRYPRVMYIVRDPRDVALSQYHYHRKCRKIDDDYPIEKFVDRFIAGETCPHGSWGENVSTWLVTRRTDPRFLLLRYEGIAGDTPRELSKIAAFVGISATPERILQAVERSSADNMRKLEKAQSHLSTLTKTSRKDLPFVRAAGAGGWRTGLPEPLVAKIEAAWAPVMQYLGYELSTRPPAKAGELDLIGSSVS